ncbi:MAG: hypothetical protein VX642_09370 [Bdellovibrionota bacterium]|nr:hypothetical protein [Bdellovibrionota bacterium]
MTKYFLILCLLGSQIFAAPYDDLFIGTKSNSRFVIPYFNFVEGAELGRFREVYEQSLSQMRRERTRQAAELLRAGAFGDEVLEIMQYIDNSIFNMQDQVKQKLDLSLYNLKAELNKLYQYYQPTGIPILFKRSSTDITKQDLNGDFFIYGTYHIDQGNLHVDMHILNLHSLIEVSFSSYGEPRAVGLDLARQLFHQFHRTRFPSELVIGSKSINMVDRGFIDARGGAYLPDLYRSAAQNCRYQGARLANRQEFDLLKLRGIYKGGVSIGAYQLRRNFSWAIDQNQIFHPHYYSAVANSNRPNYLEFICVKD